MIQVCRFQDYYNNSSSCDCTQVIVLSLKRQGYIEKKEIKPSPSQPTSEGEYCTEVVQYNTCTL